MLLMMKSWSVLGVLAFLCVASPLVPLQARAESATEEQAAAAAQAEAASGADLAPAVEEQVSAESAEQAAAPGEEQVVAQAGDLDGEQVAARTEELRTVVDEMPVDTAGETPDLSGAGARGFLEGFKLNGYIRHYMSFNLNDVPETAGDDKMKMSMNRLSLLLQVNGPLGPANVTAIGRLSREQMTSYLRDLQDRARLTSNDVDFRDHYDENELRELYFDIPVGERINLRLGKQQVVWGETDFFQAMDVVHGYDQSWRAFLEPENEEWRKPLILANAQIGVPELKGSLQLLVRPGFDSEEDIGNTYDMFGGRWAQNGSKGFDLNSVNRPAGLPAGIPSLPINYHHPEGDTDSAHYGGRWTGTIGKNDDLAYSLNYYHTQAQNPVLFPDAGAPMGLSFIYPEIDIIGGTLSGEIPIPALDMIYRAEVAYVPDQPYNNATFGVVEKDIVRSMFGLDTNLHLERVLGTSNASMLSLQIFDTWILDHDDSDAIMNAFGTREKEHSTLLTQILALPYASDTIKVQIVGVQDVSSGGGVVAPSVEFQFGPSWRLKVEADIFYGGKKSDAGNNASLFGSFANNNQFLSRLTYQF